MRTLFIFTCMIVISSSLFSQEKRLALVIGNSAYEHGGFLENPVNDANLMASTLMDLGFDVIKRTNATKPVMESSILDFWRMLATYDVNLFYYAGHGVQVNGINYLLPVDAELEDEFALKMEAVDVGEVVSQFERYPDNVNIVILDACRDDPYRSWMRSNTGGFVAMEAPSGTIIAFATSPGATASDGEGQYGLYTENLTRQIRIEQRIEDVFINTRNIVRKASGGRQNPQEWSQLTGSFYFKYPRDQKQNVTGGDDQIDRDKGTYPDSNTRSYEKLKYKEFGLKQGFYSGDQYLRPRKVGAYLRQSDSPAYSTYKKYYDHRFWGYYLSGIGIGVAGGVLLYDELSDHPPEITLYATIPIASAGLVTAIVGLVKLYKCEDTFDRFIELYRPDPYKKIVIGPTENGIGLVYRL